MQYDAFVTRQNDAYNIEFPDAPGCQTFAESAEEVVAMAREALEGWLEANLAERRVPPRPARRDAAPRGVTIARISVGPRLSAALSIRWARQDRDLSQTEAAALIGVKQQAFAKLEDPDANPSLDTLDRAAKALGVEFHVSMVPAADFLERAVKLSTPMKTTKRPPLAAKTKTVLHYGKSKTYIASPRSTAAAAATERKPTRAAKSS